MLQTKSEKYVLVQSIIHMTMEKNVNNVFRLNTGISPASSAKPAQTPHIMTTLLKNV
jgi:hypothetical protein